MTDDLLDLAGLAVAHARKLGADAVHAVAADGRSTEISVLDGRIEKVEQSEARDISLKVFAGKSSASISGSVLTKEAIHRLAENALRMAKLAPPDPHAGIADPDQLATEIPELDLAATDLPDPAKLEELAKRAEAAGLAVKGVSKSSGAGASRSETSVGIVISNGFAQGYRRTGVGVSMSAIAGEGLAMQRDYDYSSAVHFVDLRAPEVIGRTAGERAVERINPRKVKSQSVPVIYDRRVASGLIGHLLGAINGAAIARGTSFLKDAMGQQIFGPHITIVEDPHMLRGHGSRPFDGEGLACHRRNLIDQGVLTGWILDLRAARQLGLAPTGQGSRGGPSTSNVFLPASTETPEDQIRSLKQGLYVTELIGSSINNVTGDYSRGASGFWIENGELTFPVSEITIAGNLKDMFRTIRPASNLEFRSSVSAPNCLVEGLTIAGV
ncbi:TldD/PmbA family protein [Aestuariivirga litoralis]|uniref:TldD/PmbA family protein n=1 Tax=Aestuariivirga litoralis TaxID=2650924 RepID=A0A2W2C6L1_9HYPH|nr:metallopeptidase TldD-related protein [Aestuariivirga litoralis]PZF75773.1 TldD/PmbA family protein [Aestuariivirga litoralis]